MADNTTEIPVWGEELLDLMCTDPVEAPDKFENVSNLLSWSFDDDQRTYTPSYVDTLQEKEFVLGNTASIEYEKDLYRNNALDEFLVEIEDKKNVPVDIVRVQSWNGNKAKKARFLLTPKQLDKNASGEPVKLKGSLKMSDKNWTYGTWDGSKFVADTKEPEDTEVNG